MTLAPALEQYDVKGEDKNKISSPCSRPNKTLFDLPKNCSDNHVFVLESLFALVKVIHYSLDQIMDHMLCSTVISVVVYESII